MAEITRPNSGIARWIKEPYCGLSHASGAVAWLIGVTILLAVSRGGPMIVAGLCIYGAAAALLFSASALVHSLHVSPKVEEWLDRCDHSAIFLLIAGTYAPICLTALRGPWGYTILSIEGAMAVIGITAVLVLRVRLEYIAPLYLPMGWLVLVATAPMVRMTSPATIAWLVLGGVIFSAGAVVFITKRPRLWPGRFGYHDLWHTMVLAGAACHFIAICIIVM